MSSFLTNVSLYKNNVEKIYRKKGKKREKAKEQNKNALYADRNPGVSTAKSHATPIDHRGSA